MDNIEPQVKAVVLLSGGIDSTVCLTDAVLRFGASQVIALTLYYGQKHARELQSAREVAQHVGVKHIEKDLSSVFELSTSPLLRNSEEAVPEGDYATQIREANGMALTYVPFRNGLFLSFATALAYSVGAEYVIYGAHADDAAGNAYPDCSPEFYRHMNKAVIEGTSGRVQLIAPLIFLNKATIVKMGVDSNAPLHLTWSCYNGETVPCGKCGTCIDRQRAFEWNGYSDPADVRHG
jgi:7-cyano-7-deazaguanine synthase